MIQKTMPNKLFKSTNLDLIQLKEQWEALQRQPDVFAYSLNVNKQKYLKGDYRFYAEYNPERTALRRPPQTITSLNPKFSDEQFNFTKVQQAECLQTIPFKNIDVTLIINKSPLTKYHTLICPDLSACYGQRLTLESLDFSLQLMLQMDGDSEKAFRIGYNSPGALASVNHLHLHLMYIEADLYIDHAVFEHLCGGYVYRLARNMPTEAVCWIFSKLDSAADLNRKLQNLYEAIIWLCAQNLPHNLFITPDLLNSGVIKVFVYARAHYCYVKDVNQCNIGFCELSGFVPVGNLELYEALTEDLVITKIRDETGDVFQQFYDYLLQIVKSDNVNK